MSLIPWRGTTIVGGVQFTNAVIPEYEIRKEKDDKFFVVRTVAECDDIGPLPSFEHAEKIVLEMGTMLMTFEEHAWRILAAKEIKILTPADLAIVVSEAGEQAFLDREVPTSEEDTQS